MLGVIFNWFIRGSFNKFCLLPHNIANTNVSFMKLVMIIALNLGFTLNVNDNRYLFYFCSDVVEGSEGFRTTETENDHQYKYMFSLFLRIVWLDIIGRFLYWKWKYDWWYLNLIQYYHVITIISEIKYHGLANSVYKLECIVMPLSWLEYCVSVKTVVQIYATVMPRM